MKQQVKQELGNSGLSELAMENLQRNKMIRRQDSILLTFEPDEELVLKFVPEMIEVKEVEFDGVKKRRIEYTVTDETDAKKYWKVSQRTSRIIDSYLQKGQTVLKVKRIGSELKTRYIVTST